MLSYERDYFTEPFAFTPALPLPVVWFFFIFVEAPADVFAPTLALVPAAFTLAFAPVLTLPEPDAEPEPIAAPVFAPPLAPAPTFTCAKAAVVPSVNAPASRIA